MVVQQIKNLMQSLKYQEDKMPKTKYKKKKNNKKPKRSRY